MWYYCVYCAHFHAYAFYISNSPGQLSPLCTIYRTELTSASPIEDGD